MADSRRGGSGTARRPVLLHSLSVRNLRSYASLDLEFGPGPQLVWGANATGKTTLLEAVVLLALGRSHRTATDSELVRWGADYLRVEGELVTGGDGAAALRAGRDETNAPLPGASGGDRTNDAFPATSGDRVEVALEGRGRKRIKVNGVPRRHGTLAEHLRVVLFAPEEMLLIVGGPSLRRTALDMLGAQAEHAYATNLATYGRALQQRNSLLRSIRENEAGKDELRYWDEPLLAAGSAIVESRRRLLHALEAPLAAAHAEIAPGEGSLGVSYVTNAPPLPGEAARDALARRLGETAEKEVWNGTTLVGPHRDDLMFTLEARDLAGFASRGQQRTAILAFKLAQLDLLTGLDGRPPLLLLDDVFSELDPERRRHLVRRIAELPQAFVTTTDPTELDPELRAEAQGWRVSAAENGSAVERDDGSSVERDR